MGVYKGCDDWQPVHTAVYSLQHAIATGKHVSLWVPQTQGFDALEDPDGCFGELVVGTGAAGAADPALGLVKINSLWGLGAGGKG